MSKFSAVRRRLLAVACPSCHAPVGQGCMTRSGNPSACPHNTRITAANAVDKSTVEASLCAAKDAEIAGRDRFGAQVAAFLSATGGGEL